MKFPKESATKGFGFIGKRGSGKSYAAAVFAEEMFKANIPFVVFDPIDVWWGLKVAADGKGKGLPVVVFGKEHADIQLDRTMGRKIAEAVVNQNISCIISTFGMNKTEMREIIADFSERLLQINNTPRQVLIEEAHEFVPQRVQGAMARCFSAVEALLVMGRNRGIGVTLLNQRMATLNKDLLTQIDVLVAFRSVGPQDRKAFRDWVEVHNVETDENFDKFMLTVPSLPTGQAWVWSPEFLEKFEMVKFRARETFHPDREKLGMTFKMPEIKQGDVQAFIDSFTKKPERPIVLAPRAAGKVSGFTASKVDLAMEYKRGYGEGEIVGIEKGMSLMEKEATPLIQRLMRSLLKVHGDMSRVLQEVGVSKEVATAIAGAIKRERAAGERVSPPRVRPPAVLPAHERVERASKTMEHNALFYGEEGRPLSRGARSVLSYLHGAYPHWKTKTQLWVATGYSPGGGFDNVISELTGPGLIEKDGARRYASTELHDPSDIDVAFDPSLSKWDLKLGKGARAILHMFLKNPELSMTKAELAQENGYAMGGGFDNCVSELTKKELIKKEGTMYGINPEILDL